MNKQEHQARAAAKRAKAETREAFKSKAKLLLGGAILGMLATLVIGFSTDNIKTASEAQEMAREAANEAVTAALTPFCVEAFNESPKAKENLAALRKTSEWSRGQFIRDTKWSEDASSMVNDACAEKIIADADAAEEAAKAKQAEAGAAAKGG